VVEVVSPNDQPGEVRDKISDWLHAGSALVWVVDPQQREAWVYRARGTATHVGPAAALDGEDVLPGFVLPLERVL
jgi:Uma2 family endonuclease